MTRSPLRPLLVVLVLVAGACSTGESGSLAERTSPPRGSDQPSSPASGDLDWGSCGSEVMNQRIECADLAVPVDPDDPEGPTTDIALARQPSTGSAEERIGSLIMNPGGPGGSGIEFLANSSIAFPEELTDRFDLVSFDPRGVGASEPVHCLTDDQKDEQLEGDLSPDTPEERERAVRDQEELLDACTSRNEALISHMSTADVAADLDRIREAVGDDELTYLGFSYGTAIGAVYATLHPDTVRAMVLDGAVSPGATQEEENSIQAKGFERTLQAFIAQCDADPSCALAPDTAAALDRTRASLETDPVEVTQDGTTRSLGPDLFDYGLATALYSKDSWPTVAKAIANLRDGGAETILTLVDRQTGRQENGTYDNSSDAQVMVNCADTEERPSLDEAWQAAERIAAEAPTFGPLLGTSMLSCIDWPEAAEPLPDIDGAGAAPILVIGTVGDPATPYEWAEQMAGALESATLLTYEGEGHTAFLSAGACIDDAVVEYLVDLTLPEEGTRCPVEQGGGDDADVRKQLVELLQAGLPEDVATCVADGLVDEVGIERLEELGLGEDQAELQRLATPIVLRCMTQQSD